MQRWLSAKQCWLLLLLVCELRFVPAVYSQSIRNDQGPQGQMTRISAFTQDTDAALLMADVDERVETGLTVNSDELGDLDSLLDADLQTLRDTRVAAPDMNMEVTSVARTEVAVGKTPAAIFVITSQMIRRSSARTLPDILRMVPGLHVAKASNGQWSVGARGAAGIFADSLLVQVDGRSIYTPGFGGVLWQVRDMPLNDIERIEVIRGPGGSVWGANAVNGVINIVTRHSADTTGLLGEVGAGQELRHQGTLRYGGKDNNGTTWRVWGRRTEEDGGLLANGARESGTWHSNHTGFRIDRESECFDEHMIAGGFTAAGFDETGMRPSLTPPSFVIPLQARNDFHNWYINSRQVRNLGENESFELQSFIDVTHQDSPLKLKSRTLVTDLGFQHRLQPDNRHSVVWGGNYRLNQLTADETSFQLQSPSDVHYNLASMFVQDTLSVCDSTSLTIGSKFSWNDWTGFEVQPTARLVWNPTQQYAVWTSVSRAVRLPSFSNTQIQFRTPPVALAPLPTFVHIQGNPNVSAENLVAVEAGVRGQPSKDLFWDISAYYFYADDAIVSAASGARNVTFPPGFVDVLVPFGNLPGSTETGGLELFARHSMTDDWTISGSYTLAAIESVDGLARFPANKAYLQTSIDLTENLQYDVTWRYSDVVTSAGVPAWNEADVRLAWQLNDGCEFELIGRNLLDAAHFEEAATPQLQNQVSQVQRGVYGAVRFSY